eukprot:CAMPEP_0202720942 /NCGR_PEP_ID=MMETSP1385-20130828/144702_1 /ASSEMBLY_ACC=CAM_ASM_000861 /TAXON_ID=933848 /ORGANISM="Elphidium margaritaceum" /LENGTH=31 /DNA_ID= /DNA_START= /DNA_END= /DNA_ORIENTATION=
MPQIQNNRTLVKPMQNRWKSLNLLLKYGNTS